jgi:succinoglycan biosynthesis protein ExoO
MEDAYAGNSAYVRSMVKYLRENGYRVVLVVPSLRGLGRKPLAHVDMDASAFDAIELSGGIRVFSWRIRPEPILWIGAVKIVLSRAIRRLLGRGIADPGMLDISPADRAELTAVRRAIARYRPDAVLANYFLVCGIFDLPELRALPKVVIVHDIFHTRTEAFARSGVQMGHAPVPKSLELGALGKADALVAIQPTEAGYLRGWFPDRHVIVAPMAVAIREPTGAGEADSIMFVGADNGVNLAGITWFAKEVWPLVRAVRPRAIVKVYGAIGARLDPPPDGLIIAGRVPDLTAAYHQSAVCIVPLLAGSGLKIKLVEALAHGCAIVTTSVGAQGAEQLADDAFLMADTPAAFAAKTLRLLGDASLRETIGQRAVASAIALFSEHASYGPLRRYLDDATRA